MASIGQDPDPNVPSNGTSDIKIPNTKPEEELNALIAQATAKYAVKDYDAAAELYSRATELQAEINGEMSISNADLLYSYGRCLYHVAISKSDVLGSKVAGESARTTKKSARKRAADEIASDEHPEVLKVSKASNQVIPKAQSEAGPTSESKPYFQFTGDENFDDSEEEESADDDAEEEEDELSNAYEVLDLARVLLERKIKGLQGVAERTEVPPDLKGAKDRLADTHDLQAEISLEGERFSDATIDLRAALRLKQDIHPEDSSLIAEAHYKLSLALEFSSVTEQKNGAEEESAKEAYVDEAMREEAAQEMEAAISSCSLRIQREEATLKARETGDEAAKGNVSRASIDEVGEIVKDMQQRVSLRGYCHAILLTC